MNSKKGVFGLIVIAALAGGIAGWLSGRREAAAARAEVVAGMNVMSCEVAKNMKDAIEHLSQEMVTVVRDSLHKSA